MSKAKYLAGAILTLAFGAAISQNTSAITFENGSTVSFKREITGAMGNVYQRFTYSLTADSGITNLPSSPSCTVDDTSTTGTVSETCTIDFSNIQISSPGKYKIVLAETGGSSRYPVDTTTYDINIWYRNVLDSNNEPTGSYKAEIMQPIKNAGSSHTKVTLNDILFTSEANLDPTYITVTNKVKGAFANATDEFNYTVTVDGKAKDGSNLAVNIDGANISNACSYDSSLNKTTCSFALTHGQEARVGYMNSNGQIIPGSNYEVKQTVKDGYSITIDGTSSSDGKTGNKVAQENSDNNKNNYVNTSTIDNVDSKAIFNILPYIILAIAAVISIYAVRKSKQNK